MTISLANMKQEVEEDDSEQVEKPKVNNKVANNNFSNLKDFRLEMKQENPEPLDTY